MSNYFLQQIEALLEETDQIASLANVSACIKENYENLNWAGFYLVKDEELVLGPFQGKVACTHIPFNKGVCGLTYRSKQVQRVDDVLSHQDHIACDADSRSELCAPILIDDICVGMIDLDAPIINRFGEKEEKEMAEAARLIALAWQKHHWK